MSMRSHSQRDLCSYCHLPKQGQFIFLLGAVDVLAVDNVCVPPSEVVPKLQGRRGVGTPDAVEPLRRIAF